MPAWISIYCTKPIDDVKSDELFHDIQQNDFLTLAESYDVDEKLVGPALKQLRINSDGSGFELAYRPEGERPLVIHHWTEPGRVSEEIDEVLETIEGDSSPGAEHIRKHLKEVCAVVGVEMGFSQLEDMGMVFAYEVGRWYGEHRGGLIKGDDDNWSYIDDGGFVHL